MSGESSGPVTFGVAGRCPVCGRRELILNILGGKITCVAQGCPDPHSISRFLRAFELPTPTARRPVLTIRDFDGDIEVEAVEIETMRRTRRASPGPGRPPRDTVFYGQLNPQQCSRIRSAVRKHGRTEIARQARFYGLDVSYIMRALGPRFIESELDKL